MWPAADAGRDAAPTLLLRAAEDVPRPPPRITGHLAQSTLALLARGDKAALVAPPPVDAPAPASAAATAPPPPAAVADDDDDIFGGIGTYVPSLPTEEDGAAAAAATAPPLPTEPPAPEPDGEEGWAPVVVGDAATYIPPPAAPARVLAAAKTSVHVDAEYGVRVAGMGAKYTSVVEEEGDEAVARPAPPVALPPRTAHLEGEAAHQAALFGGYGRAAPTLPEGVAGQKRARAYEELGAGTGLAGPRRRGTSSRP